MGDNQCYSDPASTKMTKHDHATTFIKELEWLKINQKYKFEIGVTVYKLMNQIIPTGCCHYPQ